MTNPRTRLAPGRGWVNAPTPPAGDFRIAPARMASDPERPERRRLPLPRPPAPPQPPAPLSRNTPLPGVDITEINSDTMFDQLFGPNDREPVPTRF